MHISESEESLCLNRSTLDQVIQVQLEKIAALERELQATKAAATIVAASAGQETEALKSEQVSLLEQLANVQQHLVLAECERTRLNTQISKLRNESIDKQATLLSQYAEAEAFARDLSSKLDVAQADITGLQDENARLKAQNEELTQEAATLRSGRSQLEEELKKLQVANTQLRIEYESMQREVLHTSKEHPPTMSDATSVTRAECTVSSTSGHTEVAPVNQSVVSPAELIELEERSEDYSQKEMDLSELCAPKNYQDYRDTLGPLLRHSWAPQTVIKKAQTLVKLFSDMPKELRAKTYTDMVALLVDEATTDTKRASSIASLCYEASVCMTANVYIDDDQYSDANGPLTGSRVFCKLLLKDIQERFEERSAQARCGLMRFIGRLFRVKLLTERIIHECIKAMLAEMIRSRCRDNALDELIALFETVGKTIDVPKAEAHMSVYFLRLRESLSDRALSQKRREDVQRIIKLRANGWDATKAVY